MRSTFTANSIALLVAFVIPANALAADLHPVVEVQREYLFGATSNGKWIKAEEAAKALQDEMTYQVYGLTQSLGQARAGKPKLAQDCGESFRSSWKASNLSDRSRHGSKLSMSCFFE